LFLKIKCKTLKNSDFSKKLLPHNPVTCLLIIQLDTSVEISLKSTVGKFSEISKTGDHIFGKRD
jgi:hypothetical protein